MQRLIVVKIGGKIIDQPEILRRFLGDFAQISRKKILVHGGGNTASQVAASMGIESRMIDGRRITDRQMLKVVTMVYGGLVNKQIVSELQSQGCNALGLTGADANLIEAKIREVGEIDYGFAGDIVRVNNAAIENFLKNELVPVLAPLTHNKQGSLLNTNADTIAAAVSGALCHSFRTELFYCFDHPGILGAGIDSQSVIPEITFKDFQKLKREGTVSDGMIPKLDTAFSALQSGVKRIVICSAQHLLEAINKNNKIGSELRFSQDREWT